MSFDYFYGPDDAEQYSFYRIPKRLITGDEFQETSTEAKLLYGLMLDRQQPRAEIHGRVLQKGSGSEIRYSGALIRRAANAAHTYETG
jgi:hypothetical protein